jgi:hypothetical protein
MTGVDPGAAAVHHGHGVTTLQQGIEFFSQHRGRFETAVDIQVEGLGPIEGTWDMTRHGVKRLRFPSKPFHRPSIE